MSFLSKLHIDSQEFNVLDFDTEFSQGKDATGKPMGESTGGTIKIVIEATQNTDFLSWMLNSTLTKDGKIVFYRRDAMSKMKELKFVKAYCVNYREQFSSTNDVPMKITLVLVAKELTFGNAKFLNNWIAFD